MMGTLPFVTVNVNICDVGTMFTLYLLCKLHYFLKTERIPGLHERVPWSRSSERCGSSQESHERVWSVVLCYLFMYLFLTLYVS